MENSPYICVLKSDRRIGRLIDKCYTNWTSNSAYERLIDEMDELTNTILHLVSKSSFSVAIVAHSNCRVVQPNCRVLESQRMNFVCVLLRKVIATNPLPRQIRFHRLGANAT